MTDWQLDMTKAPYTGKRVLLATMRFADSRTISDLKKWNCYRAEVFYAKYSTWDSCWKSFPDGTSITGPHFYEPHAWAEISDPPTRELPIDG